MKVVEAFGVMANNVAIVEYVELCEQLGTLSVEEERRSLARLDQLWYSEMTAADRDEADRRLIVRDKEKT